MNPRYARAEMLGSSAGERRSMSNGIRATCMHQKASQGKSASVGLFRGQITADGTVSLLRVPDRRA